MERGVSAHPFLPRWHPIVLVASVLTGMTRLGLEQSPDQTGCPFGCERGARPHVSGVGQRVASALQFHACHSMELQRQERSQNVTTSHKCHLPLLGVGASD